jgi:hypothetical protein
LRTSSQPAVLSSATDADGERILDYAQAQAKARKWLGSLDVEARAGPYTVNGCLDDYIVDYKRRRGKALDRLEISANASSGRSSEHTKSET